MILQYQSSLGQIYDLKTTALRTRTANYHDYTWAPQTKEQQYGERVYRFNKEPVYYSTLLNIGGSIEQRKQTLNSLHEAFDRDIFNMTPGKIIHGDYYIRCYVTFSSTGYNDPFTENELNIYCPYPFWIRENKYEFLPKEDTPTANEYLDYDYDYSYDYMSTTTGQATIMNEGAGPANFKLIMYGPANNPYIDLDGATIGVQTIIADGERVEIDSQDHTVYRYATNGTKINIYNNRTKVNSVFDKITSGKHSISWPGTFGIDLILYEERSEPKWS